MLSQYTYFLQVF